MGIYQELQIRPIINAYATLTKLGGSLMPPEVLAAMSEASRSFVDLHELQRRVGDEIAALTHNEAAYVCSGAAAGLAIATAACTAGSEPNAIAALPSLSGLKNEVVIHRSHRNGYDHAVRTAGVRVVEIGSSDGATTSDLEGVLSDRTAAIYWFQGAMTSDCDVPLADVIAVGQARKIPVIVDAAAQLPPASNLWRFTEMGASLAIFSGGKDLCGPQSSGLILGRRDLIEHCRANANPNHSIGRPMKVGKEEMIGLLAAVRRYLTLDHQAREDWCEQVVSDWNEALNRVPGVSARRDFPNEAGQPLPRTLVAIQPHEARIDRDAVVAKLSDGDPIIAVAPTGPHSIYLNPMTLVPGEERIVRDRLLEILTPPDSLRH